MIDFHSHFLPSIDDGSKGLQETEAMLKSSFAQGVRSIVATPHFYADTMLPKTFLNDRQQALAQLTWDEKTMPRILLGAEVAYFDHMSRSQVMQQLQIEKTGLLLVEMPFAPWTDRIVKEVCLLTDIQGLTPVLAHVERYRLKTQFLRYRDMLLDYGVLFQCNASGFLHSFVRGWTLKQLKAGYVHFLGSDCHNMTTRAPMLGAAAKVIEKKLGQSALQEIEAFSAQMLGL